MAPNYYAVLTANVRYDKKINFRQKVLFAEITALTHSKGFCFASNSYFAKLYDVEPETISRDISALKKAGYLKVFIDKKAGNQRRIYPGTMTEESIPLEQAINRGHEHTVNTPIDHTRKHNNTSINNTSINSKRERETRTHDQPDFVEVAKQMANYFKNDETGKQQWQFMCESKGVKVEPIAITSQWAAKQCDQPYILKNWRKHTGKIINWIKKDNANHRPGSPLEVKYTPPRGKVVKSTSRKPMQRTEKDIERISAMSARVKAVIAKNKQKTAV